MRIEGPHPSSIAHFGILVANLSSGGAMRLPSSPVVVEFPLPGERREGPARSPPLLVLNGAGGLGDTWSGLVTPPSRGGNDGQGRRPGAGGVGEGRQRHPERRGHRRRWAAD